MAFTKYQDTSHDSVLYTCQNCGEEVGPVDASDINYDPEDDHDCPNKPFLVEGNRRLHGANASPEAKSFIAKFLIFLKGHEPQLLPVFKALTETSTDHEAIQTLGMDKQTFIAQSEKLWALRKVFEKERTQN